VCQVPCVSIFGPILQSSIPRWLRSASRTISDSARRSLKARKRSASASSPCSHSVFRTIPDFEMVVSPPRGPVVGIVFLAMAEAYRGALDVGA
jgi:hypothetical protein